ncbi:hypothetical protein AB0I66_21505 [Streptomyces sp. NPDC050439]|uniref:hypothetical protein n=1 Tax=unclassified Streptomyces TaxID=2593676 RepID=UPI00343EB220
MPVPLIKPEPNPATADRVAEVFDWMDAAARAFAPAVQKAGEEMARSFAALKKPRSH